MTCSATRSPTASRRRWPRGWGRTCAAKVTANFLDYHLLARRDSANIARLEAEFGDGPLLLVPHFDDDVHDIDGLLRIHRYLFASHAERARMIEKVVA